MQATAKFWDGVAPKYAKSPIKDMASYEYTLERTQSYLKESDRVLELGCGTAGTALRLAPHVAEYTATDVSPKMLEEGAKRPEMAGIDNINLVCADASQAPDGPFDVVTAFNLLHLIEDLEGTLADIAWRLPSGGLFISKTPCIRGEKLGFKFALLRLMLPVMQMIGKAPYVRLMSVAEWDKMVEAAGFDILETGNYPATPPSRYIVARKH
jgi:ubiquinone/menaquinone biosynthesis C-methylase UbiE